MANKDFPRGLSYYSGCSRLREYDVDSANTPAIFAGDAVKMEADGNVAAAAAGDAILGVSNDYLAVSTAGKVLVYDHPDTVFTIQGDGTDAEANIGVNCDILATAGDTTTLRSKFELDTSEITAATAQLRILDRVRTPDNAWGANTLMQVLINEHFYKTEVGI